MRLLVPGWGQGPHRGAFKSLLQIVGASDVDRWVLATPTRTAVYGPVRTVVWQGSAGDRRPYADLAPDPGVGPSMTRRAFLANFGIADNSGVDGDKPVYEDSTHLLSLAKNR